MYIIALFIIVISLLLMAKRNLKMAMLSLFALLLLAALFYFFTPLQEDKQENQFINSVLLKMPEVTQGYANGWKLNAQIANAHETKIVRAVLLHSQVSACKTVMSNASENSEEECPLLAEEENRIEVRVLPQAAKNITVNLKTKLSDKVIATTQGELRWAHKLIRVE